MPAKLINRTPRKNRDLRLPTEKSQQDPGIASAGMLGGTNMFASELRRMAEPTEDKRDQREDRDGDEEEGGATISVLPTPAKREEPLPATAAVATAAAKVEQAAAAAPQLPAPTPVVSRTMERDVELLPEPVEAGAFLETSAFLTLEQKQALDVMAILTRKPGDRGKPSLSLVLRTILREWDEAGQPAIAVESLRPDKLRKVTFSVEEDVWRALQLFSVRSGKAGSGVQPSLYLRAMLQSKIDGEWSKLLSH